MASKRVFGHLGVITTDGKVKERPTLGELEAIGRMAHFCGFRVLRIMERSVFVDAFPYLYEQELGVTAEFGEHTALANTELARQTGVVWFNKPDDIHDIGGG